MVRICKLVIYYFLYQFLFTALIALPSTWIQIMNNGGDVSSFTPGETTYTTTGIAMILSGSAMIWHLIHFKYVKFNLKSFGEVSGKTIGLSIPLIVAGMLFINLCSEFLGLPDLMQDTFLGMSRNVFGIISITIMAPLVEELLFRGAIQGYMLRKGMKPLNAILIASAIFGIVHMNPIQIPFAFAIGLIFGWLYYRTGSVVPGIIGHFINNSIACLQMATLTEEEFNTKTIEWLGAGPTYALFALSLAVMIGMFLYLKKHLPEAPSYKEEEMINIVKE
ncbi:MAG: CPBP family intramembrane metalloprotease [Bacteroidaceae bacterium]|nr:CPBP family intramembrane metalloprotease [Bacteroidaceae bacterium]